MWAFTVWWHQRANLSNTAWRGQQSPKVTWHTLWAAPGNIRLWKLKMSQSYRSRKRRRLNIWVAEYYINACIDGASQFPKIFYLLNCPRFVFSWVRLLEQSIPPINYIILRVTRDKTFVLSGSPLLPISSVVKIMLYSLLRHELEIK